jgi:hypothetical protein
MPAVQAPFFFGEKKEKKAPLQTNAHNPERGSHALNAAHTLACRRAADACCALSRLLRSSRWAQSRYSRLQAIFKRCRSRSSASRTRWPRSLRLSRFFCRGHRSRVYSAYRGSAPARYLLVAARRACSLSFCARTSYAPCSGQGRLIGLRPGSRPQRSPLFVISLVAQSIFLLIARAYYAAGNTSKPLFLAAVNIVFSVASAIGLLLLFEEVIRLSGSSRCCA